MDPTLDVDRTLVSKYESVFSIFMAVLAYLWRDNPGVVYPEVLYLCLALLALNLAAGLSLRLWPGRQWVSAAFILANCGAVTAILAYSGGADSNLWVLYLLPIYSVCLLLGRREVALITAGAIVLNAALLIPAKTAWGMGPLVELLLKSGVFVLTAALTWRIVDRDRTVRGRLGAKRREVEELGRLLESQKGRLEEARRMADLGLMSAGIAHDMNNVFMAILGLSDLVLEGELLTGEAREDVERIRGSAALGRSMVSNFVGLAKKEELVLVPCRVHEIVSSALKPLESALARGRIDLQLALDESAPPVMGSPAHLQRVILNLATNAMRAMKSRGILSVTAAIAPGPVSMVAVTVEDSGTGIPEEILARMFQPFKTTRGAEGGTGLGLYVCSEIALRHGGRLHGENRPEGGARFTLYLPAAREAPVPALLC